MQLLPDKTHVAFLSCRLLWIRCGKAPLFTWLWDKLNHRPTRFPGHRKTSYLLSQQVQELFVIQAVYTWRLACCRPPQTKKIFYSSKNTVAPSLWITVLSQVSHSLVQRSIQTFTLQSLLSDTLPQCQIFCWLRLQKHQHLVGITYLFLLLLQLAMKCFYYRFRWSHLSSFLWGNLMKGTEKTVQNNCLNDLSVRTALWTIQWVTTSER